MLAYAEGDANAFDQLYARHKGALYRYFVRQLPADQAHDCFQTLWLKLIRNRHSYQASAPLVNFLFTLAHNVLMDHHRSSRRMQSATDEDLEILADDHLSQQGADDPLVLAERNQLQTQLRSLTRALPFHQREAWLLLQEGNLSHTQIATVTGTSSEGVKSRLRYARSKLKAGLKAYVRQN